MPNDLIPGNKSSAMTWYLRIITWSYIILPFVTIIFWGILVYTEADDKASKIVVTKEDAETKIHKYHMAGGSIAVLGISLILMLLGIFKIRWNNWRFKGSHAIMLLSSVTLFIIW
jgi:hypothetical protein